MFSKLEKGNEIACWIAKSLAQKGKVLGLGFRLVTKGILNRSDHIFESNQKQKGSNAAYVCKVIMLSPVIYINISISSYLKSQKVRKT